jgi:FK506-binding protein 4/5
MNRGELSRFIIKPSYGYGAKGSPPTIPGGATLIFEIELFDFEGEDLSENKDKSIVRRIIQKGLAYTTPNDSARCVVNLTGYRHDGDKKIVFDQRDNLEFEIGEGVHKNIIEGLEYALTKFKKEEHSILYIKASRAWGAEGNAQFGVPENTDITYEVELKDFEKAKESWQLNWEEKIKQSELLKNKGTDLFKVI